MIFSTAQNKLRNVENSYSRHRPEWGRGEGGLGLAKRQGGQHLWREKEIVLLIMQHKQQIKNRQFDSWGTMASHVPRFKPTRRRSATRDPGQVHPVVQ